MVNSLLLLSPIGMIAIGLAATLWWKTNSKVKWKYFLFGALLWVAAIVPKFLMDMTITQPLVMAFVSYGDAEVLVFICLYVGLRTGFFESGFSYIAIVKTKFKSMKLKEAIAFGIGIGSMEAIALGVIGFLNIVAFVLDPSLVSLLTLEQQAVFDSPTIIVLAPIIERIAAVSIHVFSSVLVVYAVAKKETNYLFASISFKAVVDGIAPLLGYLFDLSSIEGIFAAEIPMIALGLIAFYGTKWIAKKRF
jgi:uncharacterized membrane protein YhfC